jgi:hypothetical protein
MAELENKGTRCEPCSLAAETCFYYISCSTLYTDTLGCDLNNFFISPKADEDDAQFCTFGTMFKI